MKTHIANSYGTFSKRARKIAAEKLNRPIQHGEYVWHTDGNPENNSPDNLEVISREEYYKRLRALGVLRRTYKPLERLSRREVAGIKYRLSLFNEPIENIAQDFQLSPDDVTRIRDDKVFADVRTDELAVDDRWRTKHE